MTSQRNIAYFITIAVVVLLAVYIRLEMKSKRVEKAVKTNPNENSNLSAFLKMIRWAEGTSADDGYRICYGYSHTINSFADHPAITGEWNGKVLTNTQCKNAGLSNGCKSTAAGAYQITKTTWKALRAKLIDLPDFSPASQDKAATALIEGRGALNDVLNGNIQTAITKCKNEWASLPGNTYGQGGKSMSGLLAYYQQQGGIYV